MTPCDFHLMVGLRCDGALINLESELGTQLTMELLGRRYSIHYTEIKTDYMCLPQVMAADCARMARVSCCMY